MKKIYIFAAVLALLTLSLNAQLDATKKKVVAQSTTTTEKVDIKFDRYFPTSPLRAGEVTPPYTCGFSDDEIDGWILIDANQDNSRWGLSEEQAVYQYNSSNAANDWLVSPGIRLQAGKTYKFYIDAKCRSTGYPERLEVKMASAVDATALTNGTTIIGSTVVNYTSYQTLSNENVTVSADGIYYIGIHAISDRDMWLLYVDNFVLDGETDPIHDLSIALSAPAKAGAGNTVTLTATVTNTGQFDENGYTVTFTANGTTFSTQNGGALAQGASATFTAQYTTDANASSVNFGASVACTDDAVATNNNATASTSLVVLPPPENVAATASDNSGTMTWDAPNITTSVVTEGFEDTSMFPEFSLGGITATQHSGSIGNWTLYDYTGSTVYTYQSVSVPNLGDPHAWMVFAPGSSQLSQSLTDTQAAHNGNQMMASFCPYSTTIASDHWLISPLLSGDAQTISFYARELTDQYGAETFEVLYSTTDNDPASFTLVQGLSATSTNWAQFSAQLPAGAKYFAIRHTSTDIFAVFVDDVTYIPGAEMPVSYNIYLEGELVGNVDANTFSYTFNNLSNGTYNCSVSAVYALGESAAVPTSFTINTTTSAIEISPETQTINDAAAGSLTVTGTDIEGNINVSAADNTNWSLNPTSLANTGGSVNVTYTGRELTATTTVTASATGATDATATVNYVADLYIVGNFGSGWDFNNGTHMSYNNGTYTATLTVNANSYILFARLLGNSNPWNTRDVFGPVSSGDWWMTGDSNGGNLDLNNDNCIYFQDGGTYTVTINATNGTFTITRVPDGQTATPTISYTVSDEYVTITATGDGTVTLNVPGYDPVSGEGSASITIPRGYASNTITVTATAQEDGMAESAPASEQITIPAGSGWTEMDGTYSANDLLSFLKDGKDIMLIDQFLESTFDNEHPDHYTYTLRQTVNGETQTSTPVTIPVYKTNSKMLGLYTYDQVTNVDKNMSLTPNAVNTEMDFDVNPDRNVLYYSLYRGDLNATYPEITAQSRVSQLQKFEEMVGDYPQYYLFESHPENIVPKFEQDDHIGNQMVERLDLNYEQATNYDDNLAYVPVIWTYGLYTARGDGKNNSYGSDIKREYMGKVDAVITGQISQGDFGTWEANGVEYRAFHPTIVATGYLPQNNNNNEVDYNDGDVAHYVPYLCRAWCTNEGIHDYGRDGDGNLMDLGEMQTPFLLGEATFGSDMTATIGGDWTHGSERDPWSFALPATVAQQDVTFIVRFYYKKVVTEAQQEGGNGKFIGGEAEEYFIAQTEGDADDMIVAINELMNGIVPVSVTYVNPQGMQSSRPFDGVNIVVTRYSDGTTRTSKIIR